MPFTTITWHTAGDDRVCPICKAIDNYVWIFEAGKDIMTDALFHPQYGIVWSMEQGSNAHAHGYLSGQTNNCRCTIEPHVDCEDILAKCVFLKETLENEASEAEAYDYKKGDSRSTTFEDIGIDPSEYGFE
jgi:hypothetical protein